MRIRIFRYSIAPVLVICWNQSLFGQEVAMTPDLVDVTHYEIAAEIEPDRNFIRGEVKVAFQVSEETLAIPFTFNKQLSIIEVRDEEGGSYSLRADDFSRDRIRVQGDDPFRGGENRELIFSFEGLLEREQYAFLDLASTQKAVIDRDGAYLLSEAHWFPNYRLATDAATASVSITVPLGFTAVAPGILDPIETLGISEVFTWRNEVPLNEIPVFVSRYLRQNFDDGMIPMTFYLREDFEKDLQPISEAIAALVDFFTSEYGEAPFGQLTLAQVGNLELGSTGSKGFMLLEDSLLDAYSLSWFKLAVRIAKQWWGNSVRIRHPSDAWLKDGFATYAALRYFQEKRSDEFETELARQAVQALKYQDSAPIISGLDLEVGSGQYQSIVASKGAWVLYMLGQLVGADKLNESLKIFYLENTGRSTSIPDFISTLRANTEEDLGWFFVQWLESVGIPEFNVDYTVFKLRDGGFKIRGQVKQSIELFKMPIDILIETKGTPENKKLQVNGKTTSFTFDTETMPVRIQMDPKGKILMDSEPMRIAVHIAIGDEYKEKGEHVSAIQEYEKAVTLNARNSLAHFRLGETFFEQHSYSNAANSMRDSLNGDLKPDWVETWAHIYLGKVYDILGQRQRARAEYQKAVNSKVEFNGAQSEAKKYLEEPYTKPSNVLG